MKKQYLYAATAIFLWATTAAVSKLLLGSLSSMQTLAASCGFAFVFLFVVCLVKGKLKLLKTYSAKDYLFMFGIGVLGTFLYNLFLFMGIDKIMASQAMIINYLWPMMSVAAACVILKEKLTVRKVIAIVMSFVGVIIVTSGGQSSSLSGESLQGTFICILAAVSYGLFVVLNKRATYDKFVSMMVYYLVAFGLSLAYVLLSGESLQLDLMQTLGMAWLGIFTHAIAYVAWALAMAGSETAKIANLAYITPFLSLVWTYFLLSEPISVSSIAGLAVIIAGIFVQLKDTTSKK